MAREQQRHHLVAQLLIAEALAGVLVARRQQHRQQVAAIGAVAAALGDQRHHHAIQRAQRRAETQVLGRGDDARQREQRGELVDRVVKNDPQRAADRVGLVGQVPFEQAAPQDAQREARQLGDDVERCAGGAGAQQPVDEIRRRRRHDSGEARQALLVKAGLREPPVPPPGRAGRRQQAVAQRLLQRVHAARLATVVVGVVLEHPLDGGGVGHQEHGPVSDPEARDGAVRARGAHQEAEPIAAKLGQHPEQRMSLRPGRDRAGGRRGRGGFAHGAQYDPAADAFARTARRLHTMRNARRARREAHGRLSRPLDVACAMHNGFVRPKGAHDEPARTVPSTFDRGRCRRRSRRRPRAPRAAADPAGPRRSRAARADRAGAARRRSPGRRGRRRQRAAGGDRVAGASTAIGPST